MILIELAKRQVAVLDDLIADTMRRLRKYNNLPHRTLILKVRGLNSANYYGQEWKNGKRTIIPLGNADSKTVILYKRQRYLTEKLKRLIKDKKVAEMFLSKFTDYSYDAIQKDLPTSYQNLQAQCFEPDVDEIVSLSYGRLPKSITEDERFQELVRWANEDYKRNPYPLPENPNISRAGIPMRSKGECMWHDNILFEGLPVRIEPEIELQGKSGQWHKLYPDFVFKCFDGTYIYVEHFGEWADEDYAERNKRRIQEYLDCGIVLGDNLIVTSDNIDFRTNELMIVEALEKIKQRMFA